jgi:hypothetical protein
MTCCIGKARIYYKEPTGFRLEYKHNNGQKGIVTAQEPLVANCLDVVSIAGQSYIILCAAYVTSRDDFGRESTGYTEFYQGPYAGPISNINYRLNSTNQLLTCNFYFDVPPREGAFTITNTALTIISYEVSLTLIGIKKYRFIVSGENTNTEYLNIGDFDSASDCPTVINNGCVMGEENYYDTLLPNQTPGGPIESSCFKKIPAENNCFHVVLETKYRPDAFSDIPHEKLRPPKIETRSQLYLCGLPGCPAEYRIECCPEGECDPPKCPPDTDCELDCGSFVCCYKNGKVIRTIRK